MPKGSDSLERELRKQRIAEAKASNRPEIIRNDASFRRQVAAWELDPPKQFVRREGWEKVLANFIKKIKNSGVTRPWKYFTFPGENALDIGHLYNKGLLETNSDNKLNVAICDQKHGDTVALKLQKVGGILASSNKELHEALADRNNVIVKQFPFDVINLDLTNALLKSNLQNMYILDQLFELQRGQAFMLLLTSRPNLSQQAEKLTVLVENLQTVPEFTAAYKAKYTTVDPSASLADFTTFTQIVFSKIVARYAREFRYLVHEHFSAKYQRVNDFESYDMVVHSFELDPIIGRRQDIAKYEPRWAMASNDRIQQFLKGERIRHQAEEGYKTYICGLPGRNILNVDEILKSQPNLNDELIKEAETLSTWLN